MNLLLMFPALTVEPVDILLEKPEKKKKRQHKLNDCGLFPILVSLFRWRVSILQQGEGDF